MTAVVHDGVSRAGAWTRARQIVRGLGVAAAMVCFWSVGALLAWVVVPLIYACTRDPLRRRARSQAAAAWSYRVFVDGLRAVTLSDQRVEGELPEEASVVVANHPCLLDVAVILGYFPRTCCVVKPGLMRNPFIAPLLYACGHVAGSRGSLDGGAEVLHELEARLREGSHVLIFPEGTRSPLGGLHPFHRGAYEVARRAHAPVVPLFLRCSPPALGKGVSVFEHPLAMPILSVEVGEARRVETGSKAACRRSEAEFRARLRPEAGPSVVRGGSATQGAHAA